MPRNLVKPQKRIEARRRIEEMIREAALWGQRLMGERELAAELGVGRKTLRSALAELESDGLLERRQGAGTFVVEQPAENGRRGVTEIAVVTARHFQDEPGWHYKGEMMKALLAYAPRMRANCTVLAFDRTEERERIWDSRYMRGFGGFITVSEDAPDLLAHLLKPRCGPVVLLDHIVRDMPIIGVVDGSFEAARAAARHLTALGHRRIAFLDCHNRDASNPWKFGGYRAGLADREIPFDEELVMIPEASGGPYYEETGFRAEMRRFAEGAVDRLLALARPPTAILCFDDSRAVPAIEVLNARGLTVGRDFAVAGQGDSAFRRETCDWLTSSRTYPRKMGRAALRAALGAGSANEGRTIIVPNRLFIRGSTCPPPGKES